MSIDADTRSELAPGIALAKGICHYLDSLDFASLMEFCPQRGLRVDVMALGPKGEIWIVECKSSRSDFMSDHKWQNYLPFCDRFFWAVAPDFPLDILPDQTGIFLADPYAAEIIRDAPELPIASQRRRRITRDFGRQAALRLYRSGA